MDSDIVFKVSKNMLIIKLYFVVYNVVEKIVML